LDLKIDGYDNAYNMNKNAEKSILILSNGKLIMTREGCHYVGSLIEKESVDDSDMMIIEQLIKFIDDYNVFSYHLQSKKIMRNPKLSKILFEGFIKCPDYRRVLDFIFVNACCEGNLDIVAESIEKLNYIMQHERYLWLACGKHMNIIKYLIGHGVKHCKCGKSVEWHLDEANISTINKN